MAVVIDRLRWPIGLSLWFFGFFGDVLSAPIVLASGAPSTHPGARGYDRAGVMREQFNAEWWPTARGLGSGSPGPLRQPRRNPPVTKVRRLSC